MNESAERRDPSSLGDAGDRGAIEEIPMKLPEWAKPETAKSDAKNATQFDATRRPELERMVTTDDAIRAAAKVAIDSADFDRAQELLGLLRSSSCQPGADIIDLGARRRGGKR